MLLRVFHEVASDGDWDLGCDCSKNWEPEQLEFLRYLYFSLWSLYTIFPLLTVVRLHTWFVKAPRGDTPRETSRGGLVSCLRSTQVHLHHILLPEAVTNVSPVLSESEECQRIYTFKRICFKTNRPREHNVGPISLRSHCHLNTNSSLEKSHLPPFSSKVVFFCHCHLDTYDHFYNGLRPRMADK